MIHLHGSAPIRNFGIVSKLSRAVLKLAKWNIREGSFEIPKAVLVAGPHTSNWDFVYGMLFMMSINLDLKWMGKASIFKWPFKGILKGMGGIPIERDKSRNAVSQVVDIMNSRERLCLALSPEGTRSKIDQWKSGFYHIAKGANAPIVIVSIDYEKKELGFGEPFFASDSIESDIDRIRREWSKYRPKKPDNF